MEGNRGGICSEHLYAHFYEDGHSGLEDTKVQTIDVTSIVQMFQHKEKVFG